MPPINQQGSRGGLITALVAFAILFITSSIFAFQFYSKYQQSAADYSAYKTRYNGVVLEGALNSPSVQALQAAKNENKLGVTPNDTIVDAALHQRDWLANLIHGTTAGTDNPAGPAADDAAATLKASADSMKSAGMSDVPLGTSLDGAIKALTTVVVAQHAQISALDSEVAKGKSDLAAAIASNTAAMTAKDAELKAQRDKAAEDLAAANKAVADSKSTYDKTQTDIGATATAVQAATAQKDAEIAGLHHDVSDRDRKIAEFQARLGHRRPSVEDTVLRQSDGKLVRVASNGVCYINLGHGDQVTAGLTFEVYDKAEGVPGLPEAGGTDEQMPVGKGSIEITHVGNTSSECRIIKITPGAVLSEGDLIANLVYDPHTKYNFFVYGDFDLSETGRPNTPDTEVIKRLITQWGGKVGETLSPSTDFVVLGSEPVVPTFPKDDITAENQEIIRKAQEKLAAYQQIEIEAKDLHIPILNQNRFLYYVGFYDQAKR